MKETKIGNMSSEIVEAIENYFKYEEEVAADCLLYLSQVDKTPLCAFCAELWFEEHHRCPNCGEKMQTSAWREYHPEVDAWEYFEEELCPNCW